MLRPYLKIWDWDLIFGRAVKANSSMGVSSPWGLAIMEITIRKLEYPLLSSLLVTLGILKVLLDQP